MTYLIVSLASAYLVFRDYGEAELRLYRTDTDLIFLLGMLIFGCVALLPWTVLVVLSERNANRKKQWFVVAGMRTSAFVYVISATITFLQTQNGEYSPLVYLFVAGFFGIFALAIGALCGLAYWAIVGRHSGKWKTAQ